MKARKKLKETAILVRLTREEKLRLKSICLKEGLTYSSWLRMNLNKWCNRKVSVDNGLD